MQPALRGIPKLPEQPGFFGRLVVSLGLPARAFVRSIPKPTQFFWFRCFTCRKLSADYFHGYSHHLICKFCKSRNEF